jgi:hypothetical protein
MNKLCRISEAKGTVPKYLPGFLALLAEMLQTGDEVTRECVYHCLGLMSSLILKFPTLVPDVMTLIQTYAMQDVLNDNINGLLKTRAIYLLSFFTEHF